MRRDNQKGNILVVDDEPNALRVLSAILSEDGYHVLESPDGQKAMSIVSNGNIDAVITDLKMPNMDGEQFFRCISEEHPDIPCIFLTAYGTVESAVHALTRGAFYYFIKPPDYHKLKAILARAVEQRRLKRDHEFLKSRLSGEGKYRIIGNSREMQDIFETIRAIKDSSSSVIVCGETGTGKELVARALHYHGSRSEKPFIAVNCAAIPRDLLESELFGYEKGAFTGAACIRRGRFEEAGGGTILLDEIGELQPALQAKLLRVLQEREIERLGSSTRIKVDFRLICSTNRDLQKEVRSGNFREDLFYRINVVQIDVPPLRQRKDDIPLLIAAFVNEFGARERKTLTVSSGVVNACQGYDWPGNIRQLRNVIERAVVIARKDEITVRDLPSEVTAVRREVGRVVVPNTLREIEIQVIRDVLEKCEGNKSRAARMLGISRKAFYKRLKDHDVKRIRRKQHSF
jgi:DNA-binding NtrC family response regulator